MDLWVDDQNATGELGSFHAKENLWHLIISTYFLVVVIDVQLPGNIIQSYP
jgi:hypothetical protein